STHGWPDHANFSGAGREIGKIYAGTHWSVPHFAQRGRSPPLSVGSSTGSLHRQQRRVRGAGWDTAATGVGAGATTASRRGSAATLATRRATGAAPNSSS